MRELTVSENVHHIFINELRHPTIRKFINNYCLDTEIFTLLSYIYEPNLAHTAQKSQSSIASIYF